MPAPASRLTAAAWWVAVVASSVLLLSCSRQSPDQELLKKADSVRSWLAALQMTAEKWSANSAPATFVRSSAETARDDFDQTSREAERSSAGPAVREPFRHLISESRAACDQLRHAAEANDRAAALPIARRLAGLQQELTALQKAHGEPSS